MVAQQSNSLVRGGGLALFVLAAAPLPAAGMPRRRAASPRSRAACTHPFFLGHFNWHGRALRSVDPLKPPMIFLPLPFSCSLSLALSLSVCVSLSLCVSLSYGLSCLSLSETLSPTPFSLSSIALVLFGSYDAGLYADAAASLR